MCTLSLLSNLSVTPYINRITSLRTLDISKNKIQSLTGLQQLKDLKSLNCESNLLVLNNTLAPISKLTKLQTLSLGKNKLDNSTNTNTAIFPSLPPKVKQLKVNNNALITIPKQICITTSLEKLDLSYNNIAALPPEIGNLVSLTELVLDNNMITSLPIEIGTLSRLKVLSLRNNYIQVKSTNFTESNPQPIPENLFTNTSIIDLNLGGNTLSNTQLNEFEGFSVFLERRKKVKDRAIHGGAMLSTSVCGLK